MRNQTKDFLIFILVLQSSLLFAYPQNIAQGYTSCATCHLSPNGGGRPSAYGHLALESLIPDKVSLMSWMSGYREHKEKVAATGYNKKRKPELHLEAGGSLRSLLLSQTIIKGPGKNTFNLIPMLMEAQAVGIYGRFSLYTSFSVLSLKDSKGKRFIKPFSREHWFMYHWNHIWHLRAGRMNLPFGLKTADHTRETRSVLNLGHSDQYYGASIDFVSEVFSLSFMPFYGNFLKYKPNPRLKEEKGLVLSFKLAKPRTFSIGISSLFKRNQKNYNEVDHSLNALLKLPFQSYMLFEIIHQAKFEKKLKQKWASFIRVGKHFYEWFDAYGEYGEIRTENFKPYLTKVRFGLKGKVLAWLEIEPFVQYKLDKGEFFETSIAPHLKKFTFALQIHAFY